MAGLGKFLLGGGIAAITDALKAVFGDKAAREAEAHKLSHAETLAASAADQAILQQFAAEFQPRARRTWWDSLVDGLNRLPRPLLALGVLALFIWAPLDPLGFTATVQAYALVPEGLWALLGVIVLFYFGGRMQVKTLQSVPHAGTLGVARDVLALQREVRSLRAAQTRTGSDEEGDETNRVIDGWKTGRTDQR